MTQKELDRVKRAAIMRYPQVIGLALFNVKTELTTSVETAAVEVIYDKNNKPHINSLKVNPDFMDSLTFSQQVFVIAHEALHIAFKHPARAANRPIRDADKKYDEYCEKESDPLKREIMYKIYLNRYHNMWNIATDACINALLRQDGFDFPKEITLKKTGQKMKLVDLKEGFTKSAEKIYDHLYQQQEEKEKEQNQQNSGPAGNQNGNQNGEQNGNQNGEQNGNQTGEQNDNQNGNQGDNQKSEQNNNQNGNQDDNQTQSQSNNQDGENSQNDSQSTNQNNSSSSSSSPFDDDIDFDIDNYKGFDSHDNWTDKNKSKDEKSSKKQQNEKQQTNEEDELRKQKEKANKKKSETDGKDEKFGKDKSETNNQDEKDGNDKLDNQKDSNGSSGYDVSEETSNQDEMNEEDIFNESKKNEPETVSDAFKNLNNKEGIKEVKTVEPVLNWRRLLVGVLERQEEAWGYRRASRFNPNPRIEERTFETRASAEVILDVSGSISVDLLKSFLLQLYPILEALTPDEEVSIKVGCFNEYFSGWTPIRSKKDIEKFSPRTGGGTNFEVAATSFTKDPGRTITKIVFTDGILGYRQLTRVPDIIWIVFGEGMDFTPLGGRIIRVRGREYQDLLNNSQLLTYESENTDEIIKHHIR